MNKPILTLITLILAVTHLFGQRVVHPITGTEDRYYSGVSIGSNFYFAADYREQLNRYDGVTTNAFPYPLRGGEQLQYRYPRPVLPWMYEGPRNMITYRSSVYQVLVNATETVKGLYRFDGTAFSEVSLGGIPISNLVVFQDRLYVMIVRASLARLCFFDGHYLTEVTGFAMPVSHEQHLTVAGNFLYVEGLAAGHPMSDYLKRFNGTSFNTLSHFPTYSSIQKITPVPGTERVYFQFADQSIYYYDGTTTTFLHDADPLLTNGFQVMNDHLYFISQEARNTRLYRCEGSMKTEVVAPGRIIADEFAVFRDKLYLTLENDDVSRLYTYDGTTFALVPGISGGATYNRAGSLLVINSPAYEYDGTTFTSISAPFDPYCWTDILESTPCYHVWRVFHNGPTDGWYVLATEVADADCTVSSEPEPESVISEDLHDYDHFVMGVAGRERDWCWTGIDVDWDYLCYPFPCIDPVVSTTLRDANGKIAWQKTFDKPFDASITLSDTQPYTLSLGVEKDKVMNEVLVVDNNLVRKGVESITVDMYPKQDYFYLTVSTDKDIKVPLTMTLRGNQGESLWQEKYTAPLDKLIREFVPKAGEYLQLSLQGESASSGVTYFPNPSNGKFSILVSEGSTPVSVSVSDFNGKTVAQKDNLDVGENAFEIPNPQSGLYILTVVEGKAIHKELISVK